VCKVIPIAAYEVPDLAYARLKRRDRRVVLLEDFTDAEMALIATSEVPADVAHFDDELKDWKP
jgi:hypothetical protein